VRQSVSGSWFNRNPKLTLTFIFIFFLVSLEASLQLLLPLFQNPKIKLVSPANLPTSYFLDELVHHASIPNSEFIRYPTPYDSFPPVRNQINSFGIRGPEIVEKKHPRVLFVGDSFLEADDVPFELVFGQRLNQYFEGSLEFLSHGIGGWSPTTEFSWIHHKGLKLDPDEVVIFLFINDFFRSEVDRMVDQTYRRQAV